MNQHDFLLVIMAGFGGALVGLALILLFLWVILRYYRKRHLESDAKYQLAHEQVEYASDTGDGTESTTSGTAEFRISSETVQPPAISIPIRPGPSFTTLSTVQIPRAESSDEEPPPRSRSPRLFFSVSFIKDSGELHVTVIRAKGLPGRGVAATGLRDPFVRVLLLPDLDHPQTSEVKRHTLAPRFGQTFIFKVGREGLTNRTLRLTVYDMDRAKVRHCLGHVTLTLDRPEHLDGTTLCRELEDIPPRYPRTGSIEVGLMYSPGEGKIRVSVCRVREVASPLRVEVGVYMGDRLAKTKTTAMYRPAQDGVTVVHESFSFLVKDRFFDRCRLEFSVYAEREPGKDGCVGRTVLGPHFFARGCKLSHWQDMLSNPREEIVRWHSIENISSSETSSTPK